MKRHWTAKFADAFRGLGFALGDQSSFAVHLAVAAVVVAVGVALGVSRWEWCLLVLCIVAVVVVEMVNTALEYLAKAISSEEQPAIGKALDISAGAVLSASVGAAVVGAIVFVPRLWELIVQR
jgi:diacylglycerol kinase (ATP)